MVDTLIVIPNQKLLSFIGKQTSLTGAFAEVDEILQQAVSSISDLIVIPGLINLDFADVRTIMGGMGKALMGGGTASGENRAIERRIDDTRDFCNLRPELRRLLPDNVSRAFPGEVETLFWTL